MKSYQEPSMRVIYVDVYDILTVSIGEGGHEDGELLGLTDSFSFFRS